MKIKIRDLRRKEKYQIDDEYLNGYARLCGWQATIVYNSLCRHADKDQYSFPSIRKMAEQHNVSRDTIIKGVKSLIEWNIINVSKMEHTKTEGRTTQGTWKSNGYTLVDKNDWKPKPVRPHSTGPVRPHSTGKEPPVRPQRPDLYDHSDTKDTHIKDTHMGETFVSRSFEKVNPTSEDSWDSSPPRKKNAHGTKVTDLLRRIEELRGSKFSNPLKQKKYIKMMLDSGTPAPVIGTRWKELRNSEWWQSHGIEPDLKNVCDSFDKKPYENK